MFTFAVYLGSIKFPSELIQTIPYLMTIVVLVIYCLTERKKRRTQKAAKKRAVEKTA
jgi:ABC-type uncharacterized transport system permease subunit